MQLNEIIEENTLESISRKTRLSPENLEKLFARDFGAFRKVRALGFISILEREYRADLSDLRAECIAFFEENTSLSDPLHETRSNSRRSSEKGTITESLYRKRTPSYIKPMLTGLIVLILLYGAWQTFSSNTTRKTHPIRGEKSGFFASIIQQGRSWISREKTTGGSSTLPETAQSTPTNEDNKTPAPFVIAQPAGLSQDKDQADNQTNRPEEQNESTVSHEVETKHIETVATATAELKVDEAIANAADDAQNQKKPLSPEVPSIVQAPLEENLQASRIVGATAGLIETAMPKQTGGENIQKEESKSVYPKIEQEKTVPEDTLAKKPTQKKSDVEKADRQKTADSAHPGTQQKQIAAKKTAQDKQPVSAKNKTSREVAAGGKIVIRPRAKIWIGKVNLATMQRSTVTTTRPFALDNLKGRWIVTTGHGRFSLKIGSRVFNYNDSKKHFLIIQNGTAHEIPHATFQKLNKSKVW